MSLSRPFRVRGGSVVVATLLLVAALPMPSAAWIGVDGPYPGNYDTHDWVIDQAMKVLDGRADGWFDVSAARAASDDPDNAVDHGSDHVYRDQGIRGGAVHLIAEHYAAAVRDYQAGRYRDASVEIGLLSHYYSDILQPYHSHYDGIGQTAPHRNYELMVEAGIVNASSRSAWSSNRRTVSQISNIRSEAVAAASFSRSKFTALHPQVVAHPTTVTATTDAITEDLLERAANDLADIIYSVSRGVGVGPPVDRLVASVKWRYPAKNEDWQHIYTMAYDAQGRPIEGLLVRVTLPSGATESRYTDGTGLAYWSGPPGATPHYARQTVNVRATTDGHTESASTWWTTTPTLASGSAGFATSVNNQSPVAGQHVTVRSTLRDTSGRAVPGVEVSWSWDYGSTTITTKALTNSSGVATSTRLIQANTTFSRVEIHARAQAGSQNRNSYGWFQRKAGDAVTPYKGWFVDIWGSKFRDDIVWLAEEGITSGCDVELFCPDGSVTRAQMATFLTRALALPATGHDYFTDDNASTHEASINRLAASGITAGCGGS
ncbi:MAG TPA: zinc dependent phospholipase C family protein, partial [Candidatus Limnocylindria bacterium]